MTLRPLRDYLLVELEQDPTEATLSPGGILLLPPKEEPRQSIGRVIAVGPGRYDDTWQYPMQGQPIRPTNKFRPTSVKIGDRVAFSKYGHSTPPGQPMQRLLREGSVHYVLETA